MKANWHILIFLMFFSCGTFNINDIAGEYINKSNKQIVLNLKENGRYEYIINGVQYNSGQWELKDKGWTKIYLYKWKDFSDFDLLNCKNSCVAIITYDDGLKFSPDDYSMNFIKKK